MDTGTGDDTLSGTWFVVRTSLPFWRGRTHAAITYAPLPDGRVADVVTYRRHGRLRTVAGVDTPLGAGRYRWRGLQPATVLTTSVWSVVATGTDWAVTHVARTLFTPEGVDLYWRHPAPSEADVVTVLDGIRDHPEVGPCVPRMFTPGQAR